MIQLILAVIILNKRSKKMTTQMLSKELLIAISYDEDLDLDNINIHELGDKLKNWALEVGFFIISGTMYDRYGNKKGFAEIRREDVFGARETDLPLCNTEPEAIIKAAEWVLLNNYLV